MPRSPRVLFSATIITLWVTYPGYRFSNHVPDTSLFFLVDGEAEICEVSLQFVCHEKTRCTSAYADDADMALGMYRTL